MADLLPDLERRLDLLVGALDRAQRYGTGLAVFVIYRAESARAAFETTLATRLQGVGQHARRMWFQPDTPPASHDLLGRLLERPPAADEVIFVYGLQHAFPSLLNSLNYRRELIPDHHWRLLFWALDDEVARVMRDAPDFWAFVNQVLDLPEVPPPEERAQIVGTLAWAGIGDSEIRNLAPAERKARIALRERLLDELPEGDDTRSTHADLHYTLAWLHWADRQYTRAEEHAQAALALARQIEDTKLYANVANELGAIYTDLPTGDRTANLLRAIEYFEEVLRIYTPDAAPLDYAITQNNLGLAYAALPTGDRDANLHRAIACYEEALRFRTPDAAPLQYATTQNNLGNAYYELGQLEQAAEAYQQAVRITPEQGNRQATLGAVLRKLGRDDEAAVHLARARELLPDDDHYNLACLEAIAGNADAALDHLEKAIAWDATLRDRAARDPDLEPLHGNPRFEAMVRDKAANERMSESANERISESANQRISESANERISEWVNG